MKASEDIRYRNIDMLKILAAFFVIILHIDGFSSLQYTLSNFSMSTRMVYHMIEAVSYPAIHLFVMCGSFLMIHRSVKLRSIFRIYLQTIIMTVIGLVICLLFFKSYITVDGLLKCLFPISFRAYWFVSEYILLMIVSPLINKAIENISISQLLVIDIALAVAFFAFPIIGVGFKLDDYWGSSYFDLFLFLYLCVATFERIIDRIRFKYILYIWLFIIFFMVISTQLFHIFRWENILFLYDYKGPFVIISALCLYLMFLKWEFRPSGRVCKILDLASKSTLIIYLYHMHPIIKTLYTKFGVFYCMRVSNVYIYILQLILFSQIIFWVGVLLGIPLNKLTNYVIKKQSSSKLFKSLIRRFN